MFSDITEDWLFDRKGLICGLTVVFPKNKSNFRKEIYKITQKKLFKFGGLIKMWGYFE